MECEPHGVEECPICEKDEADSRTEALVTMPAIQDRAKHRWLDKRLDHIDDNWYFWSCVLEMPDGKVVNGCVEADFLGENIEWNTFEQQ